MPPATMAQMELRLRLLDTLPLCDWWVLELREEAALKQTLGVVQDYLRMRSLEQKPRKKMKQKR
jgi:hypothetical protein